MFFLSFAMLLTYTSAESNTLSSIRSDSVDIPRIPQAKSNWCWAACAEMAGKTVYPNATRTQYSVVEYLKGNIGVPYPDVSGDVDDSAEGSTYVTNDTISFVSKFRGLFSIENGQWTFSEIAESLRGGNPVQVCGGYYNSLGIRTGGHVVVIYQADLIFSSSGSGNSYCIGYYDPWDDQNFYCTYDAFCDGSFNGRRYDGTIYVE